jgi:2-amino-4-hydroxy-6-hydroxymethyldihydropteridine diphosphokinase
LRRSRSGWRSREPSASPARWGSRSPAGEDARRADLARALLALGSNVERQKNLPAAVRRLADDVRIVRLSRVYDTAAVGSPSAPPFYNAALEIEAETTAAALRRDVLRPIEAELGRVRTGDAYEPRTIDLDLVWWLGPGSVPLDPDVARYRHLAEPLADVAPRLRLPATGETLRAVADRLARERPGDRIEPVALRAWERIRSRVREP